MSRRWRHIAARAVATLFCVAGVPLAVIALVRWYFDVPISDFRPVLNDEVAYWHQALTFSRVGFHGGYYTLGEVTNPSGFTPFGLHGPGFAIAYGVFGALFGWYRHSVVLLNLAAIGGAAAVWVALAQVTTARLFLSGLLFITFWPMLFWAPTGMQEGLHAAGAIVMASLFAAALRPAPHRAAIVAGWIVLALLSYIRPSWLLLLPVWALTCQRHRSRRHMIATVAASLVLAVVVIAAYTSTNPAGSPSAALRVLLQPALQRSAPATTGSVLVKVFDLSAGASVIWKNLLFNVHRTFQFGEYQPLEVLHRLQYWFWVLASAALAGVQAWRMRGRGGPAPHLVIAAATTSIALVLMLLLYTLTNWAEHRILLAFLLFGSLMCVAAPGRVPLMLVAVLVASNLSCTPLFLREFAASRRDNFLWDRRGVFELSDALEGTVVYRGDRSRWCNTLLTAQYPPYLIAVPAGIGLSVVREPDNLTFPLRSQYLLLDAPTLKALPHAIRVEELATLPYGTLYRNLDAGCQ